METSNITKTLNYAIKSHAGMKDKVGMDYILHPLAVMNNIMYGIKPESVDITSLWMEKAIILALIHDIAEDLNKDPEIVVNEIGLDMDGCDINHIALGLKFMTHDKEIPYSDYILNMCEYYDYAQGLHVFVKIADIANNKDPMRLTNFTDENRASKVEKYGTAYKHLIEAAKQFEDIVKLPDSVTCSRTFKSNTT